MSRFLQEASGMFLSLLAKSRLAGKHARVAKVYPSLATFLKRGLATLD